MFVELKGIMKQKYTWTKKYFTDAYKKMLEEHFDDYAENYNTYMGVKTD